MIPVEVVEALIVVGESFQVDGERYNRMLTWLSDYKWVDQELSLYAERETAHLSTPRLALLVKGLTLAERELHWGGGSVAGVIGVFKQLWDRGQSEDVEVVARWVFRRRANPYLPFGSTRYSSYDDYVWQHSPEFLAKELQRIREYGPRIRREQAAARIRKAQRANREIDHRRCGVEKAAQRVIELDALRALPAERRWRAIASNWDVTLDYYPKEWADDADDVLRSLSAETREELIRRLKRARTRSWRELGRRLQRPSG